MNNLEKYIKLYYIMKCNKINIVGIAFVLLILILIVYVIYKSNLFKFKENMSNGKVYNSGDYLIGPIGSNKPPSGTMKLTMEEAENAMNHFQTIGGLMYGKGEKGGAPSGFSIKLMDINPPESKRTYSRIWPSPTYRIYIDSTIGRMATTPPPNWGSYVTYPEPGNYLVMDLEDYRTVFGVNIQGRGDPRWYVQNVSKIKVYTSMVSQNGPWSYSGEYDSECKQLNKIARVLLHNPVKAKYVKIEIVAWNSYPSIRAGVIIAGSSHYNSEEVGSNIGNYYPVGRKKTDAEIDQDKKKTDTSMSSDEMAHSDAAMGEGGYYSTGDGDKNNNFQQFQLKQNYTFNLKIPGGAGGIGGAGSLLAPIPTSKPDETGMGMLRDNMSNTSCEAHEPVDESGDESNKNNKPKQSGNYKESYDPFDEINDDLTQFSMY